MATQELNHRLLTTQVAQLDFQEDNMVTWEIISLTTIHIDSSPIAITSTLIAMIGEMILARLRKWK